MIATMQVESFELAGPVWPNALCMGMYLVFFLPCGILVLWAAWRKRCLWHRARTRRYDHRALGRAAARLALGDLFVKAGSYDRFLKRRYAVGYGYGLLGVFAIAMSIMVFVCLPFGDPARLHVSETTLVLDYRWPQPDRQVEINSVTHVTYRERRGHRSTIHELQVTVLTGEIIAIQPPGYRGNRDQLFAAGERIARHANRPLEHVVDRRRRK